MRYCALVGLVGLICQNSLLGIRGTIVREMSSDSNLKSFYPSQLWIRMQFAPELEALQAFNWFPDEVLVVLVLVVVNEKNWKPFEVKSYLAFGKPEAGPAGRSLARS